MKKLMGSLSMTALAVLLASPVSAQAPMQRASVPFEFIVDGHTLPAGDYMVTKINDVGYLALRNESTGIAPIAISTIPPGGNLGASGVESLTFHRYGSDYFLASIWDGYTNRGFSVPMSRAEKERANEASLSKPEVVMVLARR